jgi:HK97 family phage major capsid protein
MQGTIFGRPVIRVPFTTNIIRVGNLAKYVILSSPDLRISTSEHTLWSTDQVAWKITARFDGLVAEEGAFREASIAATGAS